MKMSHVIAVFEDEKDNLSELKDEISKLLDMREIVIDSLPELSKTDLSKFDNPTPIVEQFLLRNSNGTVELVILDMDLSQYKEIYLSEAIITDICNRNGIPICIYSMAPEDSLIEYLSNWSEKSIVINRLDNFHLIAERCVNIFQGFQFLQEQFNIENFD